MPAGGSANERARELRDRARQLEREAANWERGAEGERRVAGVLDRLPADFVVFHDLQLPAPSKANVDHLVIGVGGAWAIDAKFYSNKVTRGSRAGADTLWTARRPLRDSLRTTAWEATKVGDLIGVTVWPMMCVIAPSIPEPAFDFDGVRICEPTSIEAQLLGSTAGPIDVVAASNAVQRVFGVAPAPRTPGPARPMGLEAPHARSVEATRRRARGRSTTATSRAGDPRRGWTSLLSSPIVRLAGIAVVALSALAVLPTAAGWGGERLGDAVAESMRDLAPTTVGRPASAPTEREETTTTIARTISYAPPDPVRYVTTCPSPGLGWVVSWVWPGTLPDGALGYRIRIQEVGGPVLTSTGAGVWSNPTDPTVDVRIGSTELMVFTDLVGPDGEVAATTEQPFLPPNGTC